MLRTADAGRSLLLNVEHLDLDASDLLLLLCSIRTPKTSVKGVVQDRQTSSRSRAPRRAPVAGV